ncbi:hypothetical protein, partial [Vibrio harveyi]
MISIFTYRSESYKNAGEALESGGTYLIDGIDCVDGNSSYTVVDQLIIVEHTANTLGHEIGFGFQWGDRYLDLRDDAKCEAWAGFNCPSELFEKPELQEYIYCEKSLKE